MTTSDTSSGKRRYSRPTPEVWAEATDLFLSGAFTLSELAARFGVSTRAIQIHAQRRRAAAAKTAPVTMMLAGITATATKLSKANHAECIEQTKTSAYEDAVTLQTLIGHALAALASDPAIPSTARLRACDQAAVALERTHKLRRVILGMSKEDDAAERPLPSLPIRMLTSAEVEIMRRKQVADDELIVAPDMMDDETDTFVFNDDEGVVDE